MTNPLIELGQKFAACKAASEAAKKHLEEVDEEWTKVELELMEAMIQAECRSITIDGVGRLTLRRQHYPSVNAANKPTFFEYLKHSGNEGLLKLDVNPQTLNAFLKRHVEELKTQIVAAGINKYQAECLRQLPGYEDVDKAIGNPVDEMDADQLAIDILKSQGAAMFEKKDIALTKG